VLLSTRGGVLSTIAVRLVRPVRSGGPGFVPFLFPRFMSASEATDVGRMTDVRGNHLRSGLTDTTSGGNASTMRRKTRAALRAATRDGQMPVVCDASSCTEGLRHMIEADPSEQPMTVIDSVEFALNHILPRLPDHAKLESLALHPTCSSTRLGFNASLEAVARGVAERVQIPENWGCCAFAGDRGMLHPELTASATKGEAADVAAMGATAHASCNRTCELGMTRATGEPYRHILELLEELTRPHPPASAGEPEDLAIRG
jgi:Fe-S oxidoreductase